MTQEKKAIYAAGHLMRQSLRIGWSGESWMRDTGMFSKQWGNLSEDQIIELAEKYGFEVPADQDAEIARLRNVAIMLLGMIDNLADLSVMVPYRQTVKAETADIRRALAKSEGEKL